MEAVKLDDGRTMLQADGQPVLVGVVLRESRTAPGRIKGMFVAQDGDKAAAMPLTQPTVCGCDKEPHGYGIEFRLENN